MTSSQDDGAESQNSKGIFNKLGTIIIAIGKAVNFGSKAI
jgi:hypothetical protein